MSYWINQPMKIADEGETIKPIIADPSKKIHADLPQGFELKTLTVKYLDEIQKLLNKHYIEDDQHLIRLVYSKDFLYWYLKYIPSEYIIGLVYHKKLVGFITAMFIDMIVHHNKLKVPYINLLCIQSKLRNMGFGPVLIDEVKQRICKMGINYGLFTSTKEVSLPFCTSIDYAIPINYTKLQAIEFIEKDLEPIQQINPNPLHLMAASDIDSVIPKLNKFIEKFDVKPYFTNDSAHHFLLPKK